MFKNNPKLKIVFALGFLFALQTAFTTYINSSFLASFIDEKFVGLVFTLSSICSIIALMVVSKMLKTAGLRKFLLSVSTINVLLLLLIAYSKSSSIVIPVFILYFTLSILVVFSLDEFLEIFSKNSSIGKIRGLYMTVINLAWVGSQMFSSRLLSQFPLKTIYLITGVIMAIFVLFVFWGLRKTPEPKYDKVRGFRYIKKFFQDKNLARSCKINFLLQFFYSLMVIYTPIYLHNHLGFSWQSMGTIFAIMLIPFVIIPFSLGKYSDKIGERRMLMFGFTIIAGTTLALFFIESREIWIWAMALLGTRVGAAMIEAMSDIYFFKHIKPENEEFIGVYRNTMPFAYIIGPLVGTAILAFVPAFNFIYAVLGAIMLSGIYFASTIPKSDV